MMCVSFLSFALLACTSIPITRAAPSPAASSSSSSSTSSATSSAASFASPSSNSCCLPRVWTADYRWSANNVTGRVFVDYTQEVFATRENLPPSGGASPRPRALNWRMQSRAGMHLHHSISSRKKRDVTYSRPVSSALELNRCLHRGRRQAENAEMEFELVDDRLITARSQCKPLVHQHTSIRVTVDASNCRPKGIQFYTYSAGRRYTYYLPPPKFALTNVHAYNDGLELDVQRFLATDDDVAQGAASSGNGNTNCSIHSNAFRPIMAAIMAQRRRLAMQRV